MKTEFLIFPKHQTQVSTALSTCGYTNDGIWCLPLEYSPLCSVKPDETHKTAIKLGRSSLVGDEVCNVICHVKVSDKFDL